MKWLENFAYRTEVPPLVYVVSILSIFALLLTIYLQTRKATVKNPVEALQEE